MGWETSPSPEGWPAPAPRDSELGLTAKIKQITLLTRVGLPLPACHALACYLLCSSDVF